MKYNLYSSSKRDFIITDVTLEYAKLYLASLGYVENKDSRQFIEYVNNGTGDVIKVLKA